MSNKKDNNRMFSFHFTQNKVKRRRIMPLRFQEFLQILFVYNQLIHHYMNTSDIVKRIMDLKKISVELKQSTEEPKGADLNLLKGILELGKGLSTPQRQMDDSPTSFSIANLMVNSKNHSFKKRSSMESDLMRESQDLQNNHSNKMREQRKKSPNHQISNLKQENGDLEKTIKELQEELQRLEQIQVLENQEEWKDGLPYFLLHYPEVKVFYTKLTILEKDYPKIDFEKYSVDLSLEKISLKQILSHSASPKKNRTINLQISQLQEVQYPSSTPQSNYGYISSNMLTKIKQQEEEQYLIVYHFHYHNKKNNSASKIKGKPSSKNNEQEDHEEEIIQTLFLKFNREEDYNEFDMGLFINYKINEQVNQKDQNEGQINFKSSSDDKNEEMKQKKLRMRRPEELKTTFKDSLKRYKNKSQEKPKVFEQEEEQIGSPMKKGKGRFIESKSNDLQELEKQDQNDKIDYIKPFLKKFNSNKHEEDDSPEWNTRKFGNDMKIEEESSDKEGIRIKKVSNIQQMFQISEKKNEEQGERLNEKTERSETSKFKEIKNTEEEDKKKKQQEIQKKLKMQEEKKLKKIEEEQRLKIEAIKKNQAELIIKTARQNLLNGYKLTKYAKGAISPYEKKVYLNENLSELRWIDVGEKNLEKHKSINIDEIYDVKQGATGPGIANHLSISKIKKKQCFVLISVKTNDRKTLEFGSESVNEMNQFCKDLKIIWDESKKKIF